MWPPQDIFAIPSGMLLTETRSEVVKMEIELKEALSLLAQLQLRVKRLKDDISQASAWISPIRRVPFDVLSFIFQLCGEDDWRTTLAIAAVSKGWREAIIATPRAWSFISLNQRINLQTAHLFFERSGHCPLHVYMPSPWSITHFPEYLARIQCLSLLALPNEPSCTFPSLEWLTIRNRFSPLRLTDLSITRFPALRHLRTNSGFHAPTDPLNVLIPTIAALETISMSITKNLAWFRVLNECKSTIVALSMDISGFAPDLTYPLVLPNLESLEVHPRFSTVEDRPIALNAPKLCRYLESGYRTRSAQFVQGHEGTVRYAYMEHDIVVSSFPLLRALRLQQYSHAENVLSQLLRSSDICPYLELIEVMTDEDVPRPLADTVMKLNTTSSRRIRLITLWPWTLNFPGSCASYMVRLNLVYDSILSTHSAQRICHVWDIFREGI